MRLDGRGSASIVAFLMAIILLSSVSAGVMLILEEYGRGISGGVRPVGEAVEALKEDLRVKLLRVDDGAVTLQVDNIGDLSVRIVKVLLRGADGSLAVSTPADPILVSAGESRTFSVTLPGNITSVGVMTGRGNVFTALSNVVFIQAGLPSGVEWSVTFNGETKSTVGDSIVFDGVEVGIYSWKASSPSMGGTRYIASPGSGAIRVPEQTSVKITYVTQHYISVGAYPPGGGSVSPSSGWYDEGSAVTISALPYHGYRFDGWRGVGDGSYSGEDNPVSIRISGPINETAVFVRQASVTFKVSGLGGDASGTVLTVNGKRYGYRDFPVTIIQDVGSNISFEWQPVIPAHSRYIWTSTRGEGYNVTVRSGRITVPVDGAIITASYKRQGLLEIESSDGGTTSPPPGTYWIDGGDRFTVRAVPADGYTFSYWLLDGVNVGSENPYTLLMDGDHRIRAVFESRGYTVIFLQRGLPAGTVWTVTLDGQRRSSADPTIIFTDVPEGSHSWSASSMISGGRGVRYVASPSIGSINVPSQTSLTITYKMQYYLRVQAYPPDGGTVHPSSGWREAGSEAVIEASPAPGYRFDGWIGGGAGSYTGNSRSATVRMDSPINETAYFVKVGTVTFSADGLSADASDIILIVDGTEYRYSDLPVSFTWDAGTTHTFEWKSLIPAGSGKRYMWTSTDGLSKSRSGTLRVPDAGGIISASYKIQYKLRVDLSPDNIEDYVSTDPAPGVYWIDAGSKVKVKAINNAQYEVTLQADVLNPPSASGISASINPASGVEFTGTLTVNVGKDASPGEYKIQVVGFEYGWMFEGWVLDGKYSGTERSIRVRMDGPHNLEAHFWMPNVKITLSQSRITVPRGESGRVTVTVEKTSTTNQNIKYLTLTVPPRVTVRVRDYRGKPLPDVTVTLSGQVKETDGKGQAVFTVQAGRYRIEVPGSVDGGDFYRWGDGENGTSRTEKISGDAAFTAIYNAIVNITDFWAAESSYWPGAPDILTYAAAGRVVYGDQEPVEGVSVKVIFHLSSWLFGAKSVTVTAETDSNGSFIALHSNPWDIIAYGLTYAEAYVDSPGYQSSTVLYGTEQRLYRVTFKQTGLPSGTEWRVTFNGYEKSGTGSSITFYAPKGTYGYTVNSPIYNGAVRYVASPISGSVTVDGEENVHVRFSREYRLTMKVSGGGRTSPPIGDHWYSPGTKVNIKATSNSGYRFSGWEGSGSGSYTGTSRSPTITINEPITETAYFTKTAKVTFSINSLSGVSASTYILTVDGESYRYSQLPLSFTWDVGSEHSFSWTMLLNAGSGRRYVWSYTSGLSAGRSGTITVPDGGGSVKANYKLQYSLTVSASPSWAGTTSPSGTGWYDAGSQVPVSASPSSSFKVSLSASGLPSGASASFNPSSDTPPFTSTLKISASSSTPPGSYRITVKALKDGYNFGYWRLDNRWISSSKRYTVYMNAPHILTAVFTQPKIKVDAQASTVNVEPGRSASVPIKVSTGSSDDTSDTFRLKVLRYVTVTVYVEDVHGGMPVPDVTVTVDGSSKKTDRGGKAVFRVLEGKHTLTVPSSADAGSRGILPFYKWSDGSTSRIRIITVSSDTSYTAIYKNLLYFSGVDAWRSGSTYYAEAHVSVKGYSGSSAYASYASVEVTWTVWYWYRWWPDYISKSGTADWRGYKHLSTTINAWGVTGVECIIEASKTGYVPTSYKENVYSSYATVKFSASGLGSDASGTVLVVDGRGYRYSDLPVSFMWQVGSKHSFEWKQTVSIMSGRRYAWKATSGITSSRSGTLTVPSGGGDVEASYKRQYYLTVKANPSTGGTVSPSSGWRDAGSSVTISASADPGYRFDGWEGSGVGSYTGRSDTATIRMEEPITETAYFVSGGSFTLRFIRVGVPDGAYWYAYIDSRFKDGYGQTIEFTGLESGTYRWHVSSYIYHMGNWYVTYTSTGTAVIDRDIDEYIYYHRL